MSRLITKKYIIFIVSFAVLAGCASVQFSGSAGSADTSSPHAPLPDIQSFSSVGYEETEYIFPQIESAAFVHDGISESLSQDDPRLFRLLNAISYSYDQGFTYWRQGFVEEEEFLTFVNSGCPMIDIRFNLDKRPDYNTEFAKSPRIIISANRYLLLVDAAASTWMTEGSIYANEHFPYAGLLIDYYDSISNDERSEIIGDIEWGNSKWINLLAYAGFQ